MRECNQKDKSGDWIKDPCCHNTGICSSDCTDPNSSYGDCTCCGGLMFKENGFWFHHSQEDIPFDKRGTVHSGI